MICYKNEQGQLHRLNGPATISYDGNSLDWYFNGMLHRYYGPAHYTVDGRGIKLYVIFDEWMSTL